MSTQESCPIPPNDTLFQAYHDNEWGMPVIDDTKLFEKVCLEGFQSGLSWKTILHRRENFRSAFEGFDIPTVAKYSQADLSRLMSDTGIIRNRRKIESAVNNANRAIELQAEFGSLRSFFWSFEPLKADRPQSLTLAWLKDNPTSPASVLMSKSLKMRGWSYVGPTTLYALMQALGMVNDHVQGCPAREIVEKARGNLVRQDTHHD